MESFLLRCPRDISSYCDDILRLTLEFLSYDPNFTDNMEEDTDNENLDEEDEEYDTILHLSHSFYYYLFIWSLVDFYSSFYLVRVQTNTLMMKILAGRFEELLPSAWQP